MSKKNAPASEKVQFELSRGLFLLILCGIPIPIIAGVAFGFWLGNSRVERAGGLALREDKVQPTAERSVMLKDGPWGKLEYLPISIEIPDDYLSVRLHESHLPEWHFVGYSREQLLGLIEQAAVTAEQRAELANEAKWSRTASEIVLHPTRELVLSLKPEPRRILYTALSAFPQNPEQEQAFALRPENLKEQFAGLSKETIALIESVLYTNRSFLLFADLPSVLHSLPTDMDKRHLEKALSRRQTGLLRLHVGPNTDINALAGYWARAGYGKDIKPMMDALAKRPGGAWMSIMNLLPPWPASRLYNFPFPSANAAEDCHWTSFNFFKDPPEAPSHDMMVWRKKLDTEYYPVQSDARYGDLIMLARSSNGSIVHSCVFLADDLVYSKDGAHHTAPWLITKVSDLVSRYSVDLPEGESIRVLYYRNRYY